jgi:hypothetical protein
VAKDRAAPFSRKHRKYWIPVTGGMVLIGLVNVTIGLCSYRAPVAPERIQLVIPPASSDGGLDASGTIGAAELPAAVMRAFAVKYPRTIPSGAVVQGDRFVVMFPRGNAHHSATFERDGTFVAEQ